MGEPANKMTDRVIYQYKDNYRDYFQIRLKGNSWDTLNHQRSFYDGDLHLATLTYRGSDTASYLELTYLDGKEDIAFRYVYSGGEKLLDNFSKHHYNKNGRLTHITNHTPQGDLLSEVKMAYDEKGRLTARLGYNNDGKKTFETQYEFDADGIYARRIAYKLGGYNELVEFDVEKF